MKSPASRMHMILDMYAPFDEEVGARIPGSGLIDFEQAKRLLLGAGYISRGPAPFMVRTRDGHRERQCRTCRGWFGLEKFERSKRCQGGRLWRCKMCRGNRPNRNKRSRA